MNILGYANDCLEPEKGLEILASDETKVITLTVTEKGSFYDEKIHSLNKNVFSIIKDLEGDEWPQTVIGFLAKALKIRFQMQ